MNKIEEIFKSWRISWDPTKEQADLASERIQICDSCEHKEILEVSIIDTFTRCNLCGCSLKLKIYTPKYHLDEGGTCPESKWNDVEDAYLNDKLNGDQV